MSTHRLGRCARSTCLSIALASGVPLAATAGCSSEALPGAAPGASGAASVGGAGGGAGDVSGCSGLGFPDPVLGSIVREALGLPPGSTMSAEQLASVRELIYIRGETSEPIRSLAGAECLTGLEVLTLDGRFVEGSAEDRITDVSPLAGLRNLRELTIQDAAFELTPLGELGQLRVLRLDYSVPGTMEAPGSLDALAPLVNLTLLDASDGCVEDISALAGMTQLVSLDLYSNCIVDLTALEGLTALRDVDITDNYYDCAAVSASLQILRANGATVADDCQL